MSIADNRIAQIKLAKLLKKGWDSYEAEPPNDIAVNNALMIEKHFKDFHLAPSVEGGIGFFNYKDGRYCDVECLNDGTIVAVKYSKTIEPKSWIVEDIEETVKIFEDFLNGNKIL